jgi:NADPH-dependent 2,4-dienoyl-CoA reductase/sulfur reductase-like enzyme
VPGPADFGYLIVGGGLAAASAVDGILERDPDARIAVLTEESDPPYQRPPLSKEFLQHPDVPRSLLYVKPEGWFDSAAGVELVTRQKAMTLDPGSMSVTTARGNVFRAPRILLATGGRARRLDVPGSSLEGIHTLRSVEDAEALREEARAGSRAVLIGAGFVGMELAASLSVWDVSSVVLDVADRAWSQVLPPDLSRWMQDHFRERGVSFHFETEVEAFRGESRVRAVELASGAIECDISVVGIGMEPCDGLAADAGLAVGDGVLVDRFGETSHPHIYAAGDVARFPDPVFGGHVRVEHWEHAREHGKAVGGNMAGGRVPYERLSYFFSRVFDLSLDVVGRTAEPEETVTWGAPGEGPCLTFAISEGRVEGAVLLDAASELESARTIVRSRVAGHRIREARHSDASSLRDLATEAGPNREVTQTGENR